MTQENQNNSTDEVVLAYSEETADLGIPLSGDLASLLAIDETREIKVHGKPIFINATQIKNYLGSEDSVISTEEELSHLLEKQLSVEDVQKIYSTQLHRKLVGQQFTISEVGDVAPEATKELVLLVPKVKLNVAVVESALESIETDNLNKYTTFLPPQTEEEKLNPIRCVTGNTLRTFLNEMQVEEGGLDLNSQIRIYAQLLINMPDEDPTKKYGVMQMRALMQYGDVVSNKNLRLALTKLVQEDTADE